MIGYYDEAKSVRNTCPICGNSAMYRVRYIYPDEGQMVCTNCKRAQEAKEKRVVLCDRLANARADLQSLLQTTPDAREIIDAIEALIDAKIEADHE